MDGTEESIRALLDDYRLLFTSHPQPMWVYDLETLRFLDVNDAAVDRYGYSRDEFLAMTIADIRQPEDVPLLMSQIEERQMIDRSGPWRHLKKDGGPLDVQITSHTIRFSDRPARLVMAEDVTEKRVLEQHLQRAQRLDSIGKLAGGVAHDFNNLLSVIINYAQFIRETAPQDPTGPEADLWQSVVKDASQIEKAGHRATELTKQLLAFARKDAAQAEVVDVNEIVQEVERLLARTLPTEIELTTVLAADPRSVLIDPGKLQQVLLNLAINARDATEGTGTITITTENVDLDPLAGDSIPGVGAGTYVKVTVADTGSGMSQQVLQQVFEPFFTTKGGGDGTGLGLATAYGIITQAGGEIMVDSELAKGSTFSVVLPEHPAGELQPS